MKENKDRSLLKLNETLLKDYYKAKSESKILYQNEVGYRICSLEDMNKQDINGILYDINRLPEVIINSKDKDINKYNQRWINDLALVELLKYYYRKCCDLQVKLAKAEDKNIVNSIIK